jgi:hypothetical protein
MPDLVMNTCLRLLMIGAMLGATAAIAAQQAVVLKFEQLRAEPFSDAKVLTALAKDARVELLQQQGAWSLVKAGDERGWVRSLSLRVGAGKAGQATGILALESGRSGTGNAVATLGIRGQYRAGDSAKPSALQALESIAAKSDGAVTLHANKTALRHPADPLRLSLLSSRAGFVYVLRTDAAGESVEFVFPNPQDRDNAIAPMKTLTLPRAGWKLPAGKVGLNHVLAVVSADPLELKFDDLTPSEPFATLPMSAANAEALQQKLATPGFGAALLAIDVGR